MLTLRMTFAKRNGQQRIWRQSNQFSQELPGFFRAKSSEPQNCIRRSLPQFLTRRVREFCPAHSPDLSSSGNPVPWHGYLRQNENRSQVICLQQVQSLPVLRLARKDCKDTHLYLSSAEQIQVIQGR